MCKACEDDTEHGAQGTELRDRIGGLLKLTIILCILVMAGLLVRDVIVNAEARRELEREISEAHYRADTAYAALQQCRESWAPVYSRGTAPGVGQESR